MEVDYYGRSKHHRHFGTILVFGVPFELPVARLRLLLIDGPSVPRVQQTCCCAQRGLLFVQA